MEKITFKDIGAIRSAEVPVRKDGGLVIVHGLNESGKSTLLDALSEFCYHDDGLELRRGADRGYVEGLGVRLTVTASSTTRKGDHSGIVLHVEGLDIAGAIESKKKDPLVADLERLLTFCKILNVRADPAPFAPLVGGPEEMAKIASPGTMSGKSQPDIAASFKEDIERKARALETERDRLDGVAAGLRSSIADIDLATPADEVPLQLALEQAITHKAFLEGKKRQAESSAALQSNARQSLDALRSLDVVDEVEAQRQVDLARADEMNATANVGSAGQAIESAGAVMVETQTFCAQEIGRVEESKGAIVRAAEQALREAQRERDEAVAATMRNNVALLRADGDKIVAAKSRKMEASAALERASQLTAAAQSRLDGARKRREDIAAAELAVSQAGGSIEEAPAPELIENALQRIEIAREAQNMGVTVRRARDQKNTADDAADQALKMSERINYLRSAASQVWDIVAQCVGPVLPEGMTIEAGRLCQQQEGGKFFFAELSWGRRTEIAVRAFAKSLRKVADDIFAATGRRMIPMLVLNQEFGESLDPVRLKIVDDLAREEGINVYTARCDAGELRAEVFGEGQGAT